MFNTGDKVQYKDDDNRVFRVHTVYSKTHVSIGLYKYPEIEQDYQTHVKNIKYV